ncbi:MAG TPA: dienelactone hydrolase, partial [Hydrogenophaga sp.]|nr:dienelactone hydrolase [Hydrogenophaga sp.]
VALNTAPLAGRFPLVVMSHGSGGSAVPDHALASTLVRAGFVVAQPHHQGNNHLDNSLAGPASFQRRPNEAIEVIDALAKDPQWSERLLLDRVGVHGMSAGGVTALSLAGAQWRLLNLVRHCDRNGLADEGFCFLGAGDAEARAARQSRFKSARYWPEFVLPAELKATHGGRTPTPEQADPRPDPRVAAVTLMVPVSAIFSAESLARIRIPVGLVSAQNDEVLVPRFHSGHVLQHCTTCKPLADLPNAGHFDVLWPWPPAVAQEVATTQVRGGLPLPGFDPRDREAAHQRIADFFRHNLGP